MHIHIKPLRFIFSNKIQNTKRLSLFDSYPWNPVLGQDSSSPTPNPSQICHNQRTAQEKKLVGHFRIFG